VPGGVQCLRDGVAHASALPMMPMLAMCCPLSKLCRRVMAPNAAGRNWRV
jgi:hypothetical protein